MFERNSHERKENKYNVILKSMEQSFANGGVQENQQKTLVAKILRKVLFADLFLIFLGTPIFFSAATLQGVSFDRIMFLVILVLVAFAVWVILGAYEGKLRIERTPIDIALVVFWVAYLLATIFSVDRWHSFVGQFVDPSRGFLVLTACIFLYYIVGSTQTKSGLRRLFGALAAAFSVYAVWGAFVLYGGLSLFPEGALKYLPIILSDSFPSQAFIAAVGMPVLATVILLFLAPGGRVWARRIGASLSALAFLANIAVLAALHVFVPWIALLIGTGFFAAYLMGNIIKAPKGWQWVGAATFLVTVMLLMLGPGMLARISQNNGPSRHYVRDAWEITKSVVPKHAVFGVGPGMYGYAFSQYYPAQWNLSPNLTTRFSRSPDVFLGILVTTGAVGALALVVLLVLTVGSGLYFLTRKSGESKLASLGAWSAAVTVIAISVSFSLRGTMFVTGALTGILAMALVLRESALQREAITVSLRTKPQYALASSFAFMVAGVGVVFMFVFIAKVIAADLYAGHAVRAADMSREDRAALFGKAIGLNKREGYYYLYMGSEFFAKAYEMLLEPQESRDINAVQQTLRTALQFLGLGRDMLPGNVNAQILLAQAYEVLSPYAQDAPAAGRAAYVRASDLEPNNPLYHVKTAELAIFEAQNTEDEQQKKTLLDEAKKRLDRALELDAAHATAYDDLGRLYEIEGNLDEAVSSFEKAVQYGRDIQSALDLARVYQLRGNDDDLKRAENVLTQVIGVNNKEINAHLGLAGLYQRTGRPGEAIDEYGKAKDLLPDNAQNARGQIDDLIAKLKQGSVQNVIEGNNNNNAGALENSGDNGNGGEQGDVERQQSPENAAAPEEAQVQQ